MRVLAAFFLALALTTGVILFLTVLSMVDAPFHEMDNLLNQYAQQRGFTGYNASDYDLSGSLKPAWMTLDVAISIALLAAVVAVFAYSRVR